MPVRHRFIAANALWFFLVGAAFAAQSTYLDDKATFQAGWNLLADEIGDTPLLWMKIEPTRISVGANTNRDGTLFSAWIVERVTRDEVTQDVLRGPGPLDWGPTFVSSIDPFRPSDMRIDRLFPVMDAALQHLRLDAPGRVRGVDAGLGLVTGRSEPVHRWVVDIANDRNEWGSVFARADGTIYGADISHTNRGKAIDLLTQADWPFDLAEAGFGAIVGAGDLVHEIKVLSHGVEIDVTSPDWADRTKNYRWNGGMFTSGVLDRPMLPAIASRGEKPFALAESGLARLPRLLDTARAAAPEGWKKIDRVHAKRAPQPSGELALLWIVELKDNPASRDKVTVRVRPDASVHSVALPQSLAAYDSYLTAEGLHDAMSQFYQAFGGDAQIFEIVARADRVSVTVPVADDPGSLVDYRLDQRGITRGTVMPRIMQDDSQLIDLTRVAKFHPDLLNVVPDMVLKSYATPGAELFMVKIWNGAPFYRHPQGTPFLKLHVGVPDRVGGGGSAVFTIDGEFIEASR